MELKQLSTIIIVLVLLIDMRTVKTINIINKLSVSSSSSSSLNLCIYNNYRHYYTRLFSLKGGSTIEKSTVYPNADMEHNNSLLLYYKMRECQDSYISSYLNKALDILSDALRLYGPNQLFSSYNGGKDAVVIMHLLRAATAKYSEDKGKIYRPKLIYFTAPDEFPEVNDFINESEKQYYLDLKRYDNGISKGLAEQINQLGEGSTPAFVLGTRKGDPNCGNQQSFSPSSSWMPAFMRINPILDWEYGHVWHFLKLFSLPYCSLYDEGYTSLGKVGDTKPNPALRRKKAISSKLDKDNDFIIKNSENDKHEYWPAYMLQDWSLERAGRLDKNKKDDLECKVASPMTSSNLSTDKKEVATVGLIIIGDEILNGFTADVNLQVAATELESIGTRLGRVVIVNDDIDAIVEEVRRMSSKYDIVITSGGIGPTHDDVTIKGIAQALGQNIIVNSVMMQHLEDVQKDKTVAMTEATKRLAMLPSGSKLRFPPDLSDNGQKQWPILQCDNIFVLPGIPQYFSSKMKVICKNFLEKNNKIEVRRVALDIEERFLVAKLNNLVVKHHEVL